MGPLLVIFFTWLAFAGAPAPVPGTLLEPYPYRGGPVPVAFFDADSTLRVSSGTYFGPLNENEVVPIPGVGARIQELNEQGFFVAVVSNQDNMLKRTSAENINRAMIATIRAAEAEGAHIHYFDYSHGPEDSKPAPVMAQRLEARLKEWFGPSASIDLAHSFMVGDAAYLGQEHQPNGQPGTDTSNFDRKFAENEGIAFHDPADFFDWSCRGIHRLDRPDDVDALVKARKLRVGEPCSKNFASLGACTEKPPRSGPLP